MTSKALVDDTMHVRAHDTQIRGVGCSAEAGALYQGSRGFHQHIPNEAELLQLTVQVSAPVSSLLFAVKLAACLHVLTQIVRMSGET